MLDILELFKQASEFIKVSSPVEKYNSFGKEKPISAGKIVFLQSWTFWEIKESIKELAHSYWNAKMT